ncbi:MAG TPA: 30S ribosomal protein S12 methylthiotransferase RimO [bacterium]|nr:30S ribosomal protein S12 methylthiotransferase RimO [bacterium]
MNIEKKVTLITLGCPKNQADSEVLAGQLRDDGFILVSDAGDADVILINTCGFIEDAKAESIETILQAVRYKENDPSREVYVWGCLSERYRGEIEKEIPEADGYFGVEPFLEIRKRLTGRERPCDPARRIPPDPTHTAYLKISDGCDHRCTFCAIPLFKGAYKSRPLPGLLEEARALAAQGVKELVLVAQDTTAYGRDLGDGTDLVRLIRGLVPIAGIAWIRILYAHPAHVTDELIRVMAEEEKVCKYLDLPLQHISDLLLGRMGRGMTRAATEALIRKLRDGIPDLTLRTAFIVGFPGETDRHFEELLHFTETARFERLGAFVYSPEEGTQAFGYPAPSREDAEARYNALMEIQQSVSEEINEGCVGRILSVLIDGKENDTLFYGRTQGDAPEIDQTVWIENESRPGDIVSVRIHTASAYDLEGRRIGIPSERRESCP